MAVSTRRRIRNYAAMHDVKLASVYRELFYYTYGSVTEQYEGMPDAVRKCLTQGSGDISRDMREIERLAEIRMIELPELI